MSSPLRLLILGAHPDDAEYHAGGLATVYRSLGHDVRMISVTNGQAGHFERAPHELAKTRRKEAAAAGDVIGAAYETWHYPDGELTASLDVRQRIITEIRQYAPDLVLTHRTNDYHPDHRAVGQAVQDASYLVTVPGVLPEVPSLRKDPVVAYMADLFTRPCPLRPDIVLDIGPQMATIVRMLACQVSQVFEWLPYEEGILDTVPTDPVARLEWLHGWFAGKVRPRAQRFPEAIRAVYGAERAERIEFVEVFEISEYATDLTPETRARLFPFAT